MAAIRDVVHRVPWTQQPQAPVPLDGSSAATRGLVRAVGFIGQFPFKVITPAGVLYDGGYGTAGMSPVVTPGGPFTKLGGGGYLVGVTSSVASTGDQKASFVTFHFVLGATGALIQTTGTGSAVDGTATLNADGTIALTCNGNATITTPALRSGVHTIAFINDRGAGRQAIWVDGIKVSAETTSTAQAGFSSDRCFSGQNTTGNLSFAGLGSFSICPPDTTMANLSANPWQIFLGQSRRMWTATATGIPTLSASTFKPATLTSTGWTPRVTAT